MKNAFLFLCILFSNLLFAQLSINNSNHVFVTDNVLYVEDGVNLNDISSNIYLRNDAQLVQGNGTTGNSGLGQLSVEQHGTVHEFAYNYWASPVGNSDIFDNSNRSFRVDLIDESTGLINSVDAGFTSGYSGTSSPLVISNYWLYTFVTGTQYSEWIHVGSSGDIAPGLGFTMKGTNGSSNNQRYNFIGKPNSGTITNTVATGEFTLVGNPYPSALDARDFIHDPHNAASISGTLFYWEQDLGIMSHYIADYQGGYATYTINASGTMDTFIPATFNTYNGDGSLNSIGSSSSSGKQARRYIPIGQGFMVEGVANGTIRTTNNQREYYKQKDSESEFFRNSNSNQATHRSSITIPDDYKRLRLNIDFNDVYTRQLVLNFHDGATDSFDYGLESTRPDNIGSDAYWVIEGVPYVAEARKFNLDSRIPLAFELNEQKAIRLRMFDIQNFDVEQPIYIHDIQTDVYTDLTNQNFEINLTEGVYTDRFEITFNNNIDNLNVENFKDGELVMYIDNENSQLTVLNPNMLKIKELNLFSLNGQSIFNYKNLPNENKHTFSIKKISSGVYFGKIITANNRVYSKKMIFLNK